MRKYDGYLICSDFDGTLINSKGELSDENLNAIKYFQANGGLFTIATGRSIDFLTGFNESFIPNTYIIAVNGTVLYDLEKKKTIHDYCLDDTSLDVVEYVGLNYDFDQEISIYSESNALSYKRNCKGNFCEMFTKFQKPWYKIIFCQKDEEKCILLKEDLIKKFGHRHNFNRSWCWGLEMQSKDSGKGECVLKLKELINKEIHTTICVGDYENDISMIKIADIGYAVKNSTDLVKQSAAHITVSNDENAIAQIIYEIDRSPEVFLTSQVGNVSSFKMGTQN